MSSSSSLKTRYLLLYNLVALAAWARLTARVLSAATSGRGAAESCARLLGDDLDYLTAVQTAAAAAEVTHAVLGLVRASPAATALQTGGRNLVVWTVMRRFFSSSPSSADDDLVCGGAGGIALLACLVAWGLSDVLRYSFFVVALARRPGTPPPAWLVWLRYSAFVPLYPVGFLSEAALVYRGLVGARDIGPLYRGYLALGLLAYIPATYILYTYMFSQRRRALGRKTEHVKST